MNRPRKPTSILEFKGAYKKNPQRRRKAEPKPTKPVGRPPPHLDKDQRKAWRDIIRQCHPGVITQMDRAALEVAAYGLAWLRTAEKVKPSELRGVMFMLGDLLLLVWLMCSTPLQVR